MLIPSGCRCWAWHGCVRASLSDNEVKHSSSCCNVPCDSAAARTAGHRLNLGLALCMANLLRQHRPKCSINLYDLTFPRVAPGTLADWQIMFCSENSFHFWLYSVCGLSFFFCVIALQPLTYHRSYLSVLILLWRFTQCISAITIHCSVLSEFYYLSTFALVSDFPRNSSAKPHRTSLLFYCRLTVCTGWNFFWSHIQGASQNLRRRENLSHNKQYMKAIKAKLHFRSVWINRKLIPTKASCWCPTLPNHISAYNKRKPDQWCCFDLSW